MRIAFNPSTVEALIAPPDNKDITFDLRGRNIFARGVKFQGTDTWRPVVDNLTSDSTTSSLSANQGRILAELINGKSDSGHTHDDRYVKKAGDTMLGALNFANSTWNLVGDDSYMGDCDISGHFGIKAANTTYPGIAFFNNANAHLGNLTAYSGNIKYGAYSLQFLDNGSTSVSASNWMNPFSTYDSNSVADGQAICVWGQSSSLSNLAADSGDMSLWLKRVNANVATLNMVLDGEYYANGYQRLAHVSEIPNSLKNPYSLTTFGVVYDGSAAKVVGPSNFISQIIEATATITDGTMLITSYASNSGFADTNAVNVPYKRKAIRLWDYIKTKTDSLYAVIGHNHDDRYLKLTGGVLKGQIILPDIDVNTSYTGSIIIGSSNTENLGIDGNEIMARNNGKASTLYLNNEGGAVQLGAILRTNSNIAYIGSQSTQNMIKFINNTSDPYGNGIAIGGGGLTIIGSGESSDVVMGQHSSGGDENMIIAGDGNIDFYSNLQDGWQYGKHMYLDTNGFLFTPSYINIGGNENNNSSPDRVWGSNGSDSYLRSYRTSALNVNYASSAGSASKVYGSVGDTGTHELVRCDMNNDQFRIIAGSNGNDNGWAEIATADDGNEPIYVRQYTGVFSTIKHTLTLLDGNGNTIVPGSLSIGGNIIFPNSSYLLWNSGSWYQRILLNDDSTADTAVFTFQQSSDSGTNWSNLMTIRDNGKIIANTFVGSLQGNASTATKLQTARNIWGQSFDGTANIDNTLRIRQTTGNYCEGIRIQTADSTWATIILGATSDSGTNANAWSIHRKADNNFAISRNSSDGLNGLVMTSVGMGLGTTAPTQRLDVAGNIRTTGDIYISHTTNNNMSYNTSNPRIVFSENGTQAVGLVYTDLDSYRISKGLKVMDVNNEDIDNVWFEVQGYNYSSGYVKNGSNDNYVLLGGGGHKLESALSVANADTVDGYHESSFLRYRGSYEDASVTKDGVGVYGWAHTNTGHNNFHESYGDIINIQGFSTWRTRFDIGTSGRIRIMHGINTTTATQVGYLAYLHDNVASATKLAAARTIWGQSFDGTADVNGTIYINNGDSSNGAIRLNNNVNSNARISAISDQVIFNTSNAIRFGETSWDWNQWAGLKYTHSNKTIYLGIADGSVFNSDSTQSGGTLNLRAGISNIHLNSGTSIIGLPTNGSSYSSRVTLNDTSISLSAYGDISMSTGPGAIELSSGYSGVKLSCSGNNASINPEGFKVEASRGAYLNSGNSGNVWLCQGGGNVSIGYSSPSYKLDVNGQVRASGFIHSDHSINDAVLLAGGGYGRIFMMGPTRYCNDTSYELAFHKLSNLCNNLVWVDGCIWDSTSTSFQVSSDYYPYLYANSPSMLTIYRMDGNNMITVDGNGLVVISCSSYPRRIGFFYTGRA